MRESLHHQSSWQVVHSTSDRCDSGLALSAEIVVRQAAMVLIFHLRRTRSTEYWSMCELDVNLQKVPVLSRLGDSGFPEECSREGIKQQLFDAEVVTRTKKGRC